MPTEIYTWVLAATVFLGKDVTVDARASLSTNKPFLAVPMILARTFVGRAAEAVTAAVGFVRVTLWT